MYDLEGNTEQTLGWEVFDMPPLLTFEPNNCKPGADGYGNQYCPFSTTTIRRRQKYGCPGAGYYHDTKMIQNINMVENGPAFLLQFFNYIALFPLPLERNRLDLLGKVKIIPMTLIKGDENHTEIEWYCVTATKLIMFCKGTLKICDFMIPGKCAIIEK